MKTSLHMSGELTRGRLSKTDFRHLKVLDLLDENGVKSLNSLNGELGFTKLIYLSHSRMERQILLMKSRYPDLELRSNAVNTPVDKQGRTPLDYNSNVIDAFKRIKKGSNY